MSVITQSENRHPSPPRNSSADVNPRAPYPCEQSDSTSAIRKESSSSMTAIESSRDTYPPFPGEFGHRRGIVGMSSLACNESARVLYTGVTFDLHDCLCLA